MKRERHGHEIRVSSWDLDQNLSCDQQIYSINRSDCARLCKYLPSINPLWIFPITGRIIGKPHPHIPALLCSDEPYKDWLWPLHKQHQATFNIVKERVMFRWWFPTTWLGSELNSLCEKQKTNITMINCSNEHISATLKSSEDKRPVMQQIIISWVSE